MTKKKTILEEGTIRRFMRLANLDPLSENYFEEEVVSEEEEMEDELAVDAMDDAEAEAEEPMDMDAEAPAEEEPAVPLEVATDVVSKVAAALEDALEIPVEVTSAEPEMGDPAEPEMEEPEMEEPEVEEPEMDMEPAEDAEAYRKEEAETPCGDVVAEEEESEEEVVAEEEGPQTITNEELVNYISQRVAQRLAEKKKA